MKIRALIGFTGALSLRKGEIAECSDEAVLRDLISAGYAELVEAPELNETEPDAAKPKAKKAKKAGATDEN